MIIQSILDFYVRRAKVAEPKHSFYFYDQYTSSYHDGEHSALTSHFKTGTQDNDIQHNNTQFPAPLYYAKSVLAYCYAVCRISECHYAEYRVPI
jgi:hypothetical protein